MFVTNRKPLEHRRRFLQISAAVLAAAIFLLDAVTPPDCVVSGLYVLVVLMAGQFSVGRQVWYVAVGCISLGLISHILSHNLISSSRQLMLVGGTNELVGITTILLSAYLIQRSRLSEIGLARARADLAQISRITTLGELTASIAHEVNQPIAGVVANASACLRWLAGEPPDLTEARASASRIVRDGTRAAQIISRIRNAFAKGPNEKVLVDVGSLIRETVDLLGNEAARYGISVQLQLEGKSLVHADAVQLQQVIVNLAVNGIDAMKEEPQPRVLSISSQRDQDGDVLVTVSDTGRGLPSEEEKVFDTFFTTKAQGTGLGLSISRSIIEAHDGSLTAGRNQPRGAWFRFKVPAAPKAHTESDTPETKV
jgi:C4-dicarboxylate-specific signal transduction histidine kinase